MKETSNFSDPQWAAVMRPAVVSTCWQSVSSIKIKATNIGTLRKVKKKCLPTWEARGKLGSSNGVERSLDGRICSLRRRVINCVLKLA